MNLFRHEFLGFKTHQSACNVYVETYNDINHILFEDISDGTSVTNMSEQLATEIINKLNLNPENCKFYEKYSNEDDIDEITYVWNNKIAKNPFWKRCLDKNIKQLWGKKV